MQSPWLIQGYQDMGLLVRVDAEGHTASSPKDSGTTDGTPAATCLYRVLDTLPSSLLAGCRGGGRATAQLQAS